MKSKFNQLLKEAEKEDVKVKLVNRVRGAHACYYSWTDMIHIEKKHSPKKRLYYLAHELGHAHYGHGGFYLDQAIRQEKQADDYSERLAIKFGFYSSSFKKYINGRRRMVNSKEYKEYLLWYGYVERKKI